jgi:hypothetical protein
MAGRWTHVAALVLVTACSGGSNALTTTQPTASASTTVSAGCGTLPTADPTASLPSDFPALAGQVLYEPSTQGKTTIVLAIVNEGDFVAVRDELVAKLKAAGYTIPGTDQESIEAEAEFAGRHDGTVKVEPLCDGFVAIRYKLNG